MNLFESVSVWNDSFLTKNEIWHSQWCFTAFWINLVTSCYFAPCLLQDSNALSFLCHGDLASLSLSFHLTNSHLCLNNIVLARRLLNTQRGTYCFEFSQCLPFCNICKEIVFSCRNVFSMREKTILASLTSHSSAITTAPALCTWHIHLLVTSYS